MPRAASEKTAATRKADYSYVVITLPILPVGNTLFVVLSSLPPPVLTIRVTIARTTATPIVTHLAKAPAAAAGAKKKSSPYNAYMKSELAKLKEKNPDMTHKERFKLAATSWAEAPENPKNQK